MLKDQRLINFLYMKKQSLKKISFGTIPFTLLKIILGVFHYFAITTFLPGQRRQKSEGANALTPFAEIKTKIYVLTINC